MAQLPKEKAEELVTKYGNINVTTLGCGLENGNPCIYQNLMFKKDAKQCAIIAVDEILDSRPSITDSQIEYQNYWQQVKEEINNL